MTCLSIKCQEVAQLKTATPSTRTSTNSRLVALTNLLHPSTNVLRAQNNGENTDSWILIDCPLFWGDMDSAKTLLQQRGTLTGSMFKRTLIYNHPLVLNLSDRIAPTPSLRPREQHSYNVVERE